MTMWLLYLDRFFYYYFVVSRFWTLANTFNKFLVIVSLFRKQQLIF